MRRFVSVSRMAKSAGVDPDDVVLRMIDRGIDIDDANAEIEGGMRKAVRAIIREMRGGTPMVARRDQDSAQVPRIEPAERSRSLLGTLSVEEVLFIHQRLCEDFAAGEDPIDPPGVRSESLLESAVSRQATGYGDLLKYHEPVVNASTLMYGVCNDHPFHNGNKRTALVSMLAHLDRNRLYLANTKQRELFRLMIAVADHSLVQQSVKVGRETVSVPRRGTPDEEVMAIAAWLRPRVEPVRRGEENVTYRQLRQILQSFGFTLHATGSGKVAICRIEPRGPLFFKSKKPKTKMAIEWPGDGRPVSVRDLKHIRQTLRLCEADGVTRDAFYSKGVRIDRFINDYRKVLRQLANR